MAEEPRAGWKGSFQVEKLILDDRLEDAVKLASALPHKQLGAVYLAIIKSYEFAPETYDPENAVGRFKTFLDRPFCWYKHQLDCQVLVWVANYQLIREALCDQSSRGDDKEDMYSASSLLQSVVSYPDKAISNLQEARESEARRSWLSIQRDPEELEAVAVYGQQLTDSTVYSLLSYRLLADQEREQEADINEMVANNSIGRCFYRLGEQYQRRRQVFKIENGREPRLSDTDLILFFFITGALDQDISDANDPSSIALDPTRMKQRLTMWGERMEKRFDFRPNTMTKLFMWTGL